MVTRTCVSLHSYCANFGERGCNEEVWKAFSARPVEDWEQFPIMPSTLESIKYYDGTCLACERFKEREAA